MSLINEDDAISRKVVLDKIEEVCFSKKQEWVDFRVSQGSNGQRDLIIKFIESLPSISENPNKWIPVSERLPGDKDVEVLTTDINDYLITAYYWSDDEEWRDSNDYRRINVTAWMPLPEPYKKSRN